MVFINWIKRILLNYFFCEWCNKNTYHRKDVELFGNPMEESVIIDISYRCKCCERKTSFKGHIKI